MTMPGLQRHTTRTITRIATGLLILLGCSSIPARAEIDFGSLNMLEQTGEHSPVPQGLVVGAVGLTYTPRYEAQEQKVLPIPGFVYFGERFMYLGDRARYYFYKDGPLATYAYGRVRFGNLDPADAAAFYGMNKRKGEFEAGIGANLVTPYALLTARASADVTGTSKGGEALLWADFPVQRGTLLVMPGAGLMWRDSKLANYYFGGISASEATAGRPAYDVGNSLSFGASLLTSWRINRDWLTMAGVFYEHYSSGIRNSPIVLHNGEVTVLVGAGYVWQ